MHCLWVDVYVRSYGHASVIMYTKSLLVLNCTLSSYGSICTRVWLAILDIRVSLYCMYLKILIYGSCKLVTIATYISVRQCNYNTLLSYVGEKCFSHNNIQLHTL